MAALPGNDKPTDRIELKEVANEFVGDCEHTGPETNFSVRGCLEQNHNDHDELMCMYCTHIFSYRGLHYIIAWL